MHEVNVLDILIPEAGSFYIMDRGFIDFSRLFRLHQAQAFFVIRAKSNLAFRRVYSRPVDKSTGLRCDQTIALTRHTSAGTTHNTYAASSSTTPSTTSIWYFSPTTSTCQALIIAQLYRCRWQVELFFKWIKQHLRIKAFYGTTENAVKTQIWIAITVYVLVSIVKKRLNLKASLYTILQILSLTLFEKTPLDQLLKEMEQNTTMPPNTKQLNLFG